MQHLQQTLPKPTLITDFAVEIRYPDDWYEPEIEETHFAMELALKVREFVLARV